MNLESDNNLGISKSKRLAFAAVMFTIPVLILVSLEVILDITNYGGNLDLFVLKKKSSGNEYVLNPEFTKRYFFKKGVNSPTPNSQRMPVEKSDSTYRIFCLGGSTTQGFPYPAYGAFPAHLQNILSSIHTELNIEVINCGISAITTHCVLDIADEILSKYEPDLIVVYAGHNEFYGVFGQASQLGLFESYKLTRLFLRLQQSKLFLLVRNMMIGLLEQPIAREDVQDANTLMGTVAKDIDIAYESSLFKRTETHFRKNLEALVNSTQKQKVPIMLCTLTSNLRDQRPFSMINNIENEKEDFGHLYGVNDYVDSDSLMKMLEHALSVNSQIAGLNYELAECYKNVDLFDKALQYYKRALDFDKIRFRAPTSFNKIIKEVAEANKVPVIDIEDTFAKNSQNGITGSELILEHLHPNSDGYYLMAKSIADVMQRNSMITGNWDLDNLATDDDYIRLSGLTLLDHEFANYKIFRLTSHWPFQTDAEKPKYQRVGDETTEIYAKKIFNDELPSLGQAHIELGKKYLEDGNLALAIPEFLAALALDPHCEIYNRIGTVYTQLTEIAYKGGNYEVAADAYPKGLWYFNAGLERCAENIDLNFNLGLHYLLRSDSLAAAERQFRKVLMLDQYHIKAKQFLAKVLIRTKQVAEAKALLTSAITNHPDAVEFQSELASLFVMTGKYEQAETVLKQALAKEPNNSRNQQLLMQINRFKNNIN